MKKNDLSKQAVEKFGVGAQLDMVMEECGELISAINHFKRNTKDSRTVLLDEIADVDIMLDQLKYIVSEEGGMEEINLRKRAKIRRLRNMLKEKD